MTTLYIATSNAGKLRDFAAAGPVEGLQVLPLPGIQNIVAPDETADTFEGNARDKAIYYSRFAPGEMVIADDSGLEVDALGGAPGVRSARYASGAAAVGSCVPEDLAAAEIDRQNNEFLLENLAGVEAGDRRARYRCVLAAARDGVVLFIAEGAVEGRILSAPRGTGGFGYDPLFYLPELGKKMAEIDLQTKHGLSHRGRAFRALLPMLFEMQD
ncbi:MAG TPA: non-canonical purine NTP pyrophosphatase [Acidisarcina sp.]